MVKWTSCLGRGDSLVDIIACKTEFKFEKHERRLDVVWHYTFVVG